MSVIVQQMINPDHSGVLFTANPQGLLNESVIVIGEGTVMVWLRKGLQQHHIIIITMTSYTTTKQWKARL